MRVLQVNNFESINGGSDRVYQLTTNLLLEKGHEVATLACGEQPFSNEKISYLLPRNSYFVANPLKTAANIRDFISRPAASKLVDQIVEEFSPDVVHLHIFYGQLSSSILARFKHHGIPCVMTVHEYRMLCPVSTLFNEASGICEKCPSGGYVNTVTNRCNRGSVAASVLSMVESSIRDHKYNYLQHIDQFFMVSDFCRVKHIQYLPSIDAKSSVLYNFVPDTVGRPSTFATHNQMMPEKYYLYCGRLSKEKGVRILCKVFASSPNMRLRIAGDGPLAPELRKEFARFSNIEFLGKLETQALKAEISGSWFTIVPSEWYENNPMSVLESFAQGVPVLGATIGGIPELVIDGKTGYGFAPSNEASLQSTLEQADSISLEERNDLVLNCLAMIEKRHSVEAHYEQLIAGYKRAIAAVSADSAV